MKSSTCRSLVIVSISAWIACGVPPSPCGEVCGPNTHCDADSLRCRPDLRGGGGGAGGGSGGGSSLPDPRPDPGIDGGTGEYSYGVSSCADGADNDQDGLTDCLDSDCADQLCRVAAGQCDVPEVCSNSFCPADVFEPASASCRPSAGDCDVAESCTGTSAFCPADLVRSGGIACRASTGVCDPAEACSGASPTCPSDAFLPSTAVCQPAAGPCDVADKCSGSTGACLPDQLAAPLTSCRAAAGPCDREEVCTGASKDCPADAMLEAGQVCRNAAGTCDIFDVCLGNSPTCPDNLRPSGVVCRAANGSCDKEETCTGGNAECPADAVQPSTVVCRASTCFAGQSIANAYCGGTKQCPVPAAASCGAYACQDAAVCHSQCTSDAACVAGFFCSANPFGGGGNSCLPKQANGTSCWKASQCSTGACTQFWRDLDHDQFTSTSAYFCGGTPPPDYRAQQTAVDCDDQDNRVHPAQSSFFPGPRSNGSFDYDCNGQEDRQVVDLGGCSQVLCSFPGASWLEVSVPACGRSGQQLTGCGFGGFSCNYSSASVVQGCR